MRKILYIILLLSSCLTGIQGQDNAFMFLRGIPQTTQLNPAFRPIKGAYFSLPAVGAVKINSTNTGFAWSDVIRPGTGVKSDSLVVDLDNLAGVLKDNNAFITEASYQLIGFGFYTGNSFITIDINQKIKGRIAYPSSLLDLRYGNWDYEGNKPINHSFSDIFIDGMGYTEFALGFSKPITDDITIGARVKYLFGAMNMKTEQFKLNVETLDNGDMRVQSGGEIVTSVPLVVEYDEDGYVESVEFDDSVDRANLVTNKNQGIGVDLGLTWQVMDHLTLGAAVNDLGYINWKSHTNKFTSDGTFLFSGHDIGSVISGEEDDTDYWEELSDSLKNTFRVSDEASSYRTGLQGSFNLSANYKHRNWLNMGAVTRNYFVDGKWYPEMTLAAGLSPGKALSTVFTYSMKKNAYANFGAGLALRGGPLQLYLVTDNLDALTAPHRAKAVNVRMGLNLIFD
ncbi:hypothetical protein DMA11_13190 [Marinilabiliaceae bacterium JC017]|nr:hypothetical protein DMA11_13190 [Marinilabiliaceae bacterium JC017]